MQTRRAQAERCRHAIGARFGAPTQHLPSGHPLGRTPPQPRRAVLHGRPPAPVQADRTAHDHGGRVSDALTRGQVDPRDALPGAAPIKCGLVALALRLSLWWRRGGTGLGVRVPAQGPLRALRAGGHTPAFSGERLRTRPPRGPGRTGAPRAPDRRAPGRRVSSLC